MPPLSIYCVLCPSFHGATLLSLVIGNHSRMLSLGDTVATEPGHHCGCGALVAECPFWRRVNGGPDGGAAMPRPELFASPRLNQTATISVAIVAFRLGKTMLFGSFAKGISIISLRSAASLRNSTSSSTASRASRAIAR